jgi:hypothetical protein
MAAYTAAATVSWRRLKSTSCIKPGQLAVGITSLVCFKASASITSLIQCNTASTLLLCNLHHCLTTTYGVTHQETTCLVHMCSSLDFQADSCRQAVHACLAAAAQAGRNSHTPGGTGWTAATDTAFHRTTLAYTRPNCRASFSSRSCPCNKTSTIY